MNTIYDKTFGEAVEAMKQGKYARLPHWKPGVWMYLYRPDADSQFTSWFFCLRTPDSNVPCEPTQTGILSNSWSVSDTYQEK